MTARKKSKAPDQTRLDHIVRFDEADPPAREERFDLSALGSAKVKKIPGGGYRIPATPARTGVQLYRNADGTSRREYRPPEEVFHVDSLSTFRDAPVTIGHPTMLDDSNRSKLQVGHVSGDARQAGEHVATDLAVTGPDAVASVDRGDTVELSCGYTCRLDPTPGTTPSGEKYDAIQRDIRINHVALLPRGTARGGSSLVLRLDGWYSSEDDGPTKPPEELTMQKIRFDGKEYAADSPELQAAIDAYKARLDGQVSEVRAERDRLDGLLTAEKEARKTADKKARTDAADEAKRFDAAIDARVELIADARKVIPDIKTRTDATEKEPAKSRTDLEIMTDVVKVGFPSVKLDGKSADYVAALFDQAVASGARSDSITQLPAILASNRQDAADPKAQPAPYVPAMTRGDL